MRSWAVSGRCGRSGILRGDGAALDVEGFDLVFDQDVIAVGGGDEDLAFGPGEKVEEEAVAGAVELAGDVVEQEQGAEAAHVLKEPDLGDLERQHEGSLLSLAREALGGVIGELDLDVVAVGAAGGEAASAVFLASVAERRHQGLGHRGLFEGLAVLGGVAPGGLVAQGGLQGERGQAAVIARSTPS